MNSRCVVNVATGAYVHGQRRLLLSLADQGYRGKTRMWSNCLPARCPQHADRPYAFKAFAVGEALRYFDQDWAAEHGVWICPCPTPYSNYEWTADSAYCSLFPNVPILTEARLVNREIPHLWAAAFAVDLTREPGRRFWSEYYHLAASTCAFVGPWENAAYPDCSSWGEPAFRSTDGKRCAICGPPDVRGHRHDQTAASVIAWRLGIPLAPRGQLQYKGHEGDNTILIADGNFERPK
jgi:hypothetical protein